VFDAGAMPPFTALLGMPEIMDKRLLGYDHVLCSGGDHRHAIRVSPRDIERLGDRLVADICRAQQSLPEKQKFLTHQPQGAQMPATKKPAPRPRATAAARDRAENSARRLEHITESLEAAQKGLASIGGSLETGVRDLRRDVQKLLRDARPDLLKMRCAVQRVVDRLQKDLATAATAKPPAARRAASATTRTAKRRRAAGSH
jgi:hypothetical protein